MLILANHEFHEGRTNAACGWLSLAAAKGSVEALQALQKYHNQGELEATAGLADYYGRTGNKAKSLDMSYQYALRNPDLAFDVAVRYLFGGEEEIGHWDESYRTRAVDCLLLDADRGHRYAYLLLDDLAQIGTVIPANDEQRLKWRSESSAASPKDLRTLVTLLNSYRALPKLATYSERWKDRAAPGSRPRIQQNE